MEYRKEQKEASKIVVVDDESEVALYLVHLLESAGFKAWATTSALEALKKIDEVIPDLVLTDLDMPGLDGTELSTILKSRSETWGITVVFLSGKTTPDEYGIAHFTGAAAYVDKPFVPGNLIRLLRRLLNSKAVHTDPAI